MDALVGVGVAILGMALIMAWPLFIAHYWRRWIWRPRRSVSQPSAAQVKGRKKRVLMAVAKAEGRRPKKRSRQSSEQLRVPLAADLTEDERHQGADEFAASEGVQAAPPANVRVSD